MQKETEQPRLATARPPRDCTYNPNAHQQRPPPHEIPHYGITERSHVIFHLFRPIIFVGPHAVDPLSDFRISTREREFHILPSLGKRLCHFTGRVFRERGLYVVEQVEPVLAPFV